MTIVAIDGPAGAGKSSVARGVADALGFTYLDSGALYRTVALAALEQGVPPASVAGTLNIEVGPRVLLDGRDVTAEIRAPEVSRAASEAAAKPDVRKALLGQQQRLLARGDWVAEGRDIGTVVAPDADLKVFLTASADERARRRSAEQDADVAATAADLARRDRLDSTRATNPLAQAPDAVVLDSTALGVDEVVARLRNLLVPA
jgi:CMP/dCMP kinase